MLIVNSSDKVGIYIYIYNKVISSDETNLVMYLTCIFNDKSSFLLFVNSVFTFHFCLVT